MPLSTLGAVGGPLIGAALLTPAAVPQWSAILQAVGSFLVSNTLVLPGTMSAAGSAVTGKGAFTVSGSASSLGQQLAAAAGSPASDLKAIALWTSIATDIINDVQSNGQANTTSFVANPSGGPVSGTGTLSFSSPALGAAIPPSIQCVDPAGAGAWLTVGGILEVQIAALAVVLATPIGFASPNGGGALTGSGTLS